MKLEHYSLTKLNKQVVGIFKKHLDLQDYDIFWFGSRVRGDNFPRADIDLGAKGPKKIPAAIKLDIEEELERLPILYKIDLVDFNNVSPDFKEEALKRVEYVKFS